MSYQFTISLPSIFRAFHYGIHEGMFWDIFQRYPQSANEAERLTHTHWQNTMSLRHFSSESVVTEYSQSREG